MFDTCVITGATSSWSWLSSESTGRGQCTVLTSGALWWRGWWSTGTCTAAAWGSCRSSCRIHRPSFPLLGQPAVACNSSDAPSKTSRWDWQGLEFHRIYSEYQIILWGSKWRIYNEITLKGSKKWLNNSGGNEAVDLKFSEMKNITHPCYVWKHTSSQEKTTLSLW